jgi:hypothetical protein
MTGMPEPHRVFLEHALSELQRDDRILGVAAGGSFLTQHMDEFSDLDLVLAIEPHAIDAVMHDRPQIASRLGRLVAAFTGEHVGEPRLLICLYEDPLLHVDLKFVNLLDVAERVETPTILWERDTRFATELTTKDATFPEPDLQWIEDRFWVWVHYAATKIGRGELFEAIDFLAFLRLSVLGPLSLLEAGARPSGVRKIELLAPQRVQEMRQTLATYDRQSCIKGVQADICAQVIKYISLFHMFLFITYNNK